MNDVHPNHRPFIPRALCVVRYIYALNSRNLDCGVWDGTSFIGWREKFGSTFLTGESHWDDGAPHGTAKPLELIGIVPEAVPLLATITIEVEGQKVTGRTNRELGDCLNRAWGAHQSRGKALVPTGLNNPEERSKETAAANLHKGETTCNRSACQRPIHPGYRWYNTGTQQFYCEACAKRINDPFNGPEPLCSLEVQET